LDSIDKINLLLVKKGWTGADLSRAIGVSGGTYSQWNTKLTKPSKRNLRLIAEKLGCDILDIMDDKDLQKNKKIPIREDPDGEVDRITERIKMLSAEDRQLIETLLDTLERKSNPQSN